MSAPGRQHCAAAVGDEAGLYRDLQPRLLALLGSTLTVREQTLEDACSTAWVALIRCQPERGESLLGWLYVVACHEAYRLLELDARVPSFEPDALVALAGAEERTGELRAAALEALEALAALPERQRRLLAAKAAGHSYRELMALERSSYSAVNRHLTRARNAIREGRGANSGGPGA